MTPRKIEEYFTEDVLTALFPKERTDRFFDALFGDASEGSFDIRLTFGNYMPEQKTLNFELHLHERPGKCLACNLTYGLPEVFSRHPVININGLVREIEQVLDGRIKCTGWRLRGTQSRTRKLHVIPLTVSVAD